MEQQSENSFFRTNLSTIDGEGKRKWVYSKKPKGKLYNYRRLIGYSLLLFFLLAPHMRINDHAFILINIFERKFILFGTIFWPQDTYIMAIAMLSLMVFFILFTVIFGRIWCGWLCPQTLFLELVFRPIEFLILGSARKQRILKEQSWTIEKIMKIGLTKILFIGFSFLIINTLFAWVIGFSDLLKMYSEPFSQNTSGWLSMIFLSGFFFFIYNWFREQACTIMCPYGRLQGVLLDNNSIVISYDYIRGEPRDSKVAGDCINCNSCVDVCPTGIDIRNGTQLECINCSACVDACNGVMKRINKPKGLIRYASENQITHKQPFRFNIRIGAYSLLLLLLLGFFSYLLTGRQPIESTILRTPGLLSQRVGSDSISNLYNLKIVNKTFDEFPVQLRLLSHSGKIKMIKQKEVVPKGGLMEDVFFVILSKNSLKQPNENVTIGVFSKENKIEEINLNFVSKAF
ncbi:MAG: cytochrome c oxidase accessory protein CcoG [Bacteroidales bacterium]|nr:cytochrome c oxidase accessory protein CcoG [Bacteroidales bacterium]